MEFRKYPSVINLETKMFERAVEHVKKEHPHTYFAIQEKIHGCNFGIYISKEGVKYASRNKFLDPDEKFYNYQSVIPKWDLSKLPEGMELIVYGELFGEGIQKGVDYGPGKKFIAFDVIMNGKLMEVFSAKLLCEEFLGLPFSNIIYAGSLDACLKFNSKFNSHITRKPNNTCEGIVIKPLEPLFYGRDRICFKKINEEFKEKKQVKKNPKKQKISAEDMTYFNTVQSYVTENRIKNVLSKESEDIDKGKLIHLVYQDILEAMKQDDISENKKMKKYIIKEIVKCIL